MLTIAEIMNTDLVTLAEDDNLSLARELMANHRIRHLPVVDSAGKLVGLVTQRDVLAAADSTLLSKPDAAVKPESYIAVSSVMTVSVHTITETTNLRAAAMYLQKHKIGCLPVERKGKLVGIVTDSDFVTVAVHLMELLEAQEPDEFGLVD
jgi:CBS domain-containing membrane protein